MQAQHQNFTIAKACHWSQLRTIISLKFWNQQKLAEAWKSRSTEAEGCLTSKALSTRASSNVCYLCHLYLLVVKLPYLILLVIVPITSSTLQRAGRSARCTFSVAWCWPTSPWIDGRSVIWTSPRTELPSFICLYMIKFCNACPIDKVSKPVAIRA